MGQILYVVAHSRTPSGQLPLAILQMAAADPPIDKTPPSLVEVREGARKLTSGKAAGVCNVSIEVFKARSKVIIHGLHPVLYAMWQSSAIPLN